MLLPDNIVHFSRILRKAGMKVGPDRVLAAIAAVEAVGLARRSDVHAALGAVMLDQHEQQMVFDAAFDACWRAPGLLEQGLAAVLPTADVRSGSPQAPRTPQARQPRRIAEALAPQRKAEQPQKDQRQAETTFRTSEYERLRHADFEAMTADEYQLAQSLAGQAPLPVQPVLRRRHERAPRGRIDLRRTLQGMARQPHTLTPVFSSAQRELQPIVVLLDISGSMNRYSRIFLHYVHGLTRRRLKVQTFTFGTRLSNITRCLRDRDPDVALKKAEALVQDWKGGTRIASSLEAFNRCWARRVLGAHAAVLLVTDGLDRDEQGQLGLAAAQLRRMAHQVVWLNPLLRFDGFEPRAAGVRALLPHVDRFLPVHNLASLADLGRALHAPAVHPSSLLHD